LIYTQTLRAGRKHPRLSSVSGLHQQDAVNHLCVFMCNGYDVCHLG